MLRQKNNLYTEYYGQNDIDVLTCTDHIASDSTLEARLPQYGALLSVFSYNWDVFFGRMNPQIQRT